MKTIAATALILTLTASAFAAEPQKPVAQDTKKAQAPIVLTATQLDGVTAGEQHVIIRYEVSDPASSTSDGGNVTVLGTTISGNSLSY